MSAWILLGLIAGALIPIQSGINAGLRQPLGSPMLAALVSFGAGSLALVLGCLVSRTPLPSWETVQTIRPWAWFGGGLCGALFVTANVLMTPRLGIGTTLVITLVAQLVVSVALDHFGAFDTPVRPLNLPRVAGIALLVTGTVLVKRF